MKKLLFIIILGIIFASCAAPEFGHTRKNDRHDKWERSTWHRDYKNTGNPPIKVYNSISH